MTAQWEREISVAGLGTRSTGATGRPVSARASGSRPMTTILSKLEY